MSHYCRIANVKLDESTASVGQYAVYIEGCTRAAKGIAMGFATPKGEANPE